MSKIESTAEAKTATEPLATPMMSLISVRKAATEVETTVAFFCFVMALSSSPQRTL